MKRALSSALALAGLLGIGMLYIAAGSRTIELEVPLPPAQPLTTGARLGFLEIRETGAYTWVHPGGEMINALKRDLFRAENLKLVEGAPAPLPEQEFSEIEQNAPYMRRIGEKLAADYLLTGEVRFSTLDVSGFYPVEIERRDGSTLQTTQYQERKEYKMTFVFYLFDGHTGALVHKDNYTATERLATGATEDLAGFYLLYEKIRTDLLVQLTTTRRREIRYLYK